jgi:hypothetical protein
MSPQRIVELENHGNQLSRNLSYRTDSERDLRLKPYALKRQRQKQAEGIEIPQELGIMAWTQRLPSTDNKDLPSV